MFLNRSVLMLCVLIVAACNAKQSPPDTRAEALEWLRSNWSTAEAPAKQIVQLCALQQGDFTIAGNGISSNSAIEPEDAEQFTREMDRAHIALVRCMEKSVLLHVGGGIEGSMSFDGAYQFSPLGFPGASECYPRAFPNSGSGSCTHMLANSWYITMSWYDSGRPET